MKRKAAPTTGQPKHDGHPKRQARERADPPEDGELVSDEEDYRSKAPTTSLCRGAGRSDGTTQPLSPKGQSNQRRATRRVNEADDVPPTCQSAAETSAGSQELHPMGNCFMPPHSVSWEEFKYVSRELEAMKGQTRMLEGQMQVMQKEAQCNLVKFNSFVCASDEDRKQLKMEIQTLKEENCALATERDSLRTERADWQHQTQTVVLEPSLLEACRALDELASAAVHRYRQDSAV